MTYKLAVEMEMDGGFPRKVAGGYYRFSVSFVDENQRRFTVTGFRCTASNPIAILPPASITKSGGIFSMISMEPEIMRAVIDAIEPQRRERPPEPPPKSKRERDWCGVCRGYVHNNTECPDHPMWATVVPPNLATE